MSYVDLLARLSPAERARSAVAAAGSLVWAADGEAGCTPFEQECGLPLLLGNDALASHLLESGAGRVEFDLHPALGVVSLSGQFWPVADAQAAARLHNLQRQHSECTTCPAAGFTRVIGLQAVTAAIRLPGEPNSRAIGIDEFILAEPDPVAVTGASLARHLNADHAVELAMLASVVSGVAVCDQFGARAGVVDIAGFELYVTGPDGGSRYLVRFADPARGAHQLPELMHSAIAEALQHGA